MNAALIIDAVVLAAVLEADLGRGRKIGKLRIVRPLIVAAAIIPLFLKAVVTSGNGLSLEVIGTSAGVVLGLIAAYLMTVYRSPRTDQPLSRAGFAYAALWIVVIGARAAFSYGSTHWFSHALGAWMAQNSVTSAAIIDALIFMAVTMVLTRTIALAVRARRVAHIRPGKTTQPVQAF